MGTKQKISENGTYVLDPEEIEQLGELSFTSVLFAVIESIEHENSEPKASDIAAPTRGGDTTINEILKGSPSSNDPPPAHPDRPSKPGPAETPGDLIAPEFVFPELPPRRR